jgi:hypothetical protein
MGIRNELTEQDQRLLEKIDEIVANESGERREVDSLYGFCAHLASTVPQADDAFRQRLETRLVVGLRQPRSQAEGTTLQRRSLAELGRVVLGWNPLAVRRKWALAAVTLCAVVAIALLAHPLAMQFGALVGNVVPAQRETPQITHAPTPTPDSQPTHTPVVFSSPTKVVERAGDRTSQPPTPLGYVSTWAVHRAR